MTERAPRLLLIELNEFSVELFQRGVRELKLPHVARMLAMRSSSTTTDDLVEHRGLDPWVQWVSVHTGVPSTEHGIVHLGDTPSALGMKQLWETLSEQGMTSGVWGAMNATRGRAQQCKFFLPDPWTFSEDAYPPAINDLLALPRYYSKNYLDVSKAEFARRTIRLIKYVLTSGAVLEILGMSPMILRAVLRNGVNNATLFSLFDLFSAALFLRQRERHHPQLSIIFLNSIAHLQHHRWEAGPLTKDVSFGLRAIDRVLGMLFGSLAKDEAVVVMNALTQRNISHEKPQICYRQINPARFIDAVGLKFDKVEQLMTNDAHVFFPDKAGRDSAVRILEQVTLRGESLFHVEANAQDDLKLFYRVDFWDEVGDSDRVIVNGHDLRFLEHFEAIVARTGAHIQEGIIFAEGISLPHSLYNHEVSNSIIAHLSRRSSDAARFANDSVGPASAEAVL
jgi:hypothetical protein